MTIKTPLETFTDDKDILEIEMNLMTIYWFWFNALNIDSIKELFEKMNINKNHNLSSYQDYKKSIINILQMKLDKGIK